MEENDGNSRSFDSVIRNCANDFAQDDKLGGWWRRTGNRKSNSRFLHCAAHDETVSSFGRNDGLCAAKRRRRRTVAIVVGKRWKDRVSFDSRDPSLRSG
jgi:hypothetical protein